MKNKLLPLLFVLGGYSAYSQVVIGKQAANASAQLEVYSKDKGLLIPQVPLTGSKDQTTIKNGNVNSLLVFNTATISRGVLSIFGLYRTQWVGLDGAPETSSFSINTPINNSRLGVGLSLVNDKIGPTNENNISADVSYTIQTSSDFKLSFGIKGTANIFNLDINKLNPEDQGDPQFQDLDNKFSPNVGAGVYWHSDKAYIGFSVPNFIETNRYDDNDVAIYKDKINYYLMGGYVFNLDKYQYYKFKPAVLAKMVQGAPLQVDISANFMFIDRFVVGVAYRWSASLSAMVGFQITDGLYLGYGYDRETTHLNNYNSGSHEIFLRYEFFKNNGKMTTPRFF